MVLGCVFPDLSFAWGFLCGGNLCIEQGLRGYGKDKHVKSLLLQPAIRWSPRQPVCNLPAPCWRDLLVLEGLCLRRDHGNPVLDQADATAISNLLKQKNL